MALSPLVRTRFSPRSTASGSRRRAETSTARNVPDIGNQAMARLLSGREMTARSNRSPPHSSASVGAVPIAEVDGPLERVADSVADRVLAGTAPHRPVEPGSARFPGTADRRKAPSASTTATGSGGLHDMLGALGRPLDPATRAYFERRFGRDFSDVRVHTGAAVDRAASDLGALAYTVGRHIAFAGSRYAPGSAEGRRLIAHELAHVVQQEGAPPVVQRAPDRSKPDVRPQGKGTGRKPPPPGKEYPLFRPVDQVIELKRGVGDDWELTMSGHVSVESLDRALWKRFRPPWVEVTLKVAAIDPVYLGIFHLDNLRFSALEFMEPSIAELFVARGLVDESIERRDVQEARTKFGRRHSGLGQWRLSAIKVALEKATRRNPDLLVAWYNYYAENGFESEELSLLGETVSGDTAINEDVLLLNKKFPTDEPLSLLGSTLIHDFVHTPHGGRDTIVGSAPSEAKAYGIELFFAERMGDKQREEVISNRYNKNDPVDMRMGGDQIFNESYLIMKKLYEIIDQGGPEGAEARIMSVEFISKNEGNYGPKLKAFIAKYRR